MKSRICYDIYVGKAMIVPVGKKAVFGRLDFDQVFGTAHAMVRCRRHAMITYTNHIEIFNGKNWIRLESAFVRHNDNGSIDVNVGRGRVHVRPLNWRTGQ